MQIALLISGDLGLKMLKHCLNSTMISALLTDKSSREIIDFAHAREIPLFIGNPRNGRAMDFIRRNPVDWLLSVNYLFIVEKDIIKWPNLGAVNLHGSILPKYRGRTPHVWAIINNESETGVTAHIITEGCDAGSIIKQIRIPINQGDTGADLLEKYKAYYPKLIDTLIVKFKNNSILAFPQDELKATYFCKRTPNDGLINWDWQKERIYNWIRAQAFPYPGAFSFQSGRKIIIDQVAFDDFGYHQNQPNGLVITKRPIRIKTPNGVLRLVKVRGSLEEIETNKILDNHEN